MSKYIKPEPATPHKEEKCGLRVYQNWTQAKIDKAIEELRGQGVEVTGNNPVDIDPHQHGIKGRIWWSESQQTIWMTILDKKFYVKCSWIWDKIDPVIRQVCELSAEEMA